VRATSFLERATLRRRLRYLRRRRELALRELGELVLESHRGGERSPELAAKLTSAEQIESESERLERALDERTELLVLREPGITVCGSCAALHGSEDRFCPHCGTPTRKG
jgi:rubrerythrin